MTGPVVVVMLSEAQPHALSLVVAWMVEDNHPDPVPAALRGVVGAVEYELLEALADAELRRWESSRCPGMASATGAG